MVLEFKRLSGPASYYLQHYYMVRGQRVYNMPGSKYYLIHSLVRCLPDYSGKITHPIYIYRYLLDKF